jgi:hypothetical protein
MKREIMILISLFTWLSGHGQEPAIGSVNRQPYFQLLYHTGVYWSRTQYLEEQFADGYRAIDARFGLQTTGKEMWQQYHHYPRYGLGIHYADLIRDPNDTIVGNPFSAFFFYGAPWARYGRFTFNTDMALGLSYTSLIHDPVTNPINDVIASHFNLFFDFSFNIGFRLASRMDLSAGYGVTHYSNGRIHQPQKGVNNWGWTFGLSYLFNGPGNRSPNYSGNKKFSRAEFIYREPPLFKTKEYVQLMYAVGVVDLHKLGEVNGVHYFTSSFTADYAIQYSPRSAVTLGADILYDGSLERGIGGVPPEEVTTFMKTYLGGHVGYQFIVDRVTILINLGTYFMQHSYDRGFIFSRWGGRIRLTEHVHAHLCIKTRNGVRSDWIEWGLAAYLKTR